MWFAVHTKSNKEKIVKTNLENENFKVFLPLLHKGESRKKETIKPLFPGYLFVFTGWPGLRKVMWTSGVKKILGYGQDPVPIEEDIIQSIRARADRSGIIYPDNKFKLGDKVRVIDGLFSGQIGIIENIKSEKERIRILLSLFDIRMRLEIDLGLAEKVA